jgi:hypothetical protein
MRPSVSHLVQCHGVNKLVYLISASGKRKVSKGSWLTYLLTTDYSMLTSIADHGSTFCLYARRAAAFVPEWKLSCVSPRVSLP